MRVQDQPTAAEAKAAVDAWLQRGGSVTRLKVGKSCKRPLTFEGFNDQALIEPEPRRSRPEPK